MGFGPKEGWAVLAALPAAAEIGGDGWRITAQRASRVVALPPKSDAAVRARAAKKVGVWRSYRNDRKSQTLWIGLTPFVSRSDAQAELARLPENLLRKPFWKSFNEETGSADGIGADTSMSYSEESQGPRGRHATTTLIAGTVGSILIVLDFSTSQAAWDPTQISAIATAQFGRARELFNALA
jgi:hypothetical protein